MPKVPVVGDSGSALQGIRAPGVSAEPSFGGGNLDVAQAAAGLSQSGARFSAIINEDVVKAKQSADDARLVEVRTAANRWELDNIYGPGGAVEKRGRDAFNVGSELNESWDKFVEDQSKNLSNDQQKQLLQKFSASRKDQISNWSQQHTAQQVQVYKAEQYKDSTESSKERVAADPTKADTEIEFLELSVSEYKAGMHPESQAQELQKQTSDLVVRGLGTITGRGDYKGAEAFLARHDSLVDPDTKEKIKPIMAEAKLRYNSGLMSNKIIGSSGSKVEAYLKVADIQDQALRSKVKDGVKDYYDLKDQAKEDFQNRSMEAATQIIEADPWTPIPPAILQPLTVPQRNSLEDRAEKLRKGIPITTDQELFYDLKTRAAGSDTRADFLKENLLQYKGKLSESDFQAIVNIQTSIKKGDNFTVKALEGYKSKQMILRSAIDGAGYGKKFSADSDGAKNLAALNRMIDTEVSDIEESTKKKINNKEYQEVVDSAMLRSIQILDPGGSRYKKLAIFEMGSRPSGYGWKISYADIPLSERRAIARSLKDWGKPVNEFSITQLYEDRVKKAVGE